MPAAGRSNTMETCDNPRDLWPLPGSSNCLTAWFGYVKPGSVSGLGESPDPHLRFTTNRVRHWSFSWTLSEIVGNRCEYFFYIEHWNSEKQMTMALKQAYLWIHFYKAFFFQIKLEFTTKKKGDLFYESHLGTAVIAIIQFPLNFRDKFRGNLSFYCWIRSYSDAVLKWPHTIPP